jgi:hypothetical protein
MIVLFEAGGLAFHYIISGHQGVKSLISGPVDGRLGDFVPAIWFTVRVKMEEKMEQ